MNLCDLLISPNFIYLCQMLWLHQYCFLGIRSKKISVHENATPIFDQTMAQSQKAYKTDLIAHSMTVDALKFGSFVLKSGR